MGKGEEKEERALVMGALAPCFVRKLSLLGEYKEQLWLFSFSALPKMTRSHPGWIRASLRSVPFEFLKQMRSWLENELNIYIYIIEVLKLTCGGEG